MGAISNHKFVLHQGRVFSLTRENITLDNGATIDIDIIRHPGASAQERSIRRKARLPALIGN